MTTRIRSSTEPAAAEVHGFDTSDFMVLSRPNRAEHVDTLTLATATP
jgi:hypothetical protein